MRVDVLAKTGRGTAAAIFLMLVAGALSPPLSATVTIPLTVKRMVEVADLVLEAKVLGYAARDGTVEQGPECPAVQLRYTDMTFNVRQVYKGRITSPSFLVRVLGGRVENGRILRDTYLPFRIGESNMLFLQMNGTDDFPFVGFHQGILRFRASGPNRTMPDLDLPDTCVDCVQMVVDGHDHLLLGFNQGFLNTMPASRRPMFRLVVGPGENVPPEPNIPSGGVFPPGASLPAQIASPALVRNRVRGALQALGLPTNPPPLGDPSYPVADELLPGDPIVRCGLPALLSDENEAFIEVPGGDVDPPIDPGPSEQQP